MTLEANPVHGGRPEQHRAGLSGVVELRQSQSGGHAAQAGGGVAWAGFIFIGADKPGYVDYFDWSLKLARIALIFADNVVRSGNVADPDHRGANVQGGPALPTSSPQSHEYKPRSCRRSARKAMTASPGVG